jgi:hypothetical protein
VIITLVVLLALAIGFVGGALVMCTTKPLVVERPTPTISSIPLVPAITRKQHPEAWN